MSLIVDIDVYGEETTSGDAKVYTGDEAISNAIVAFLTSKKTTYINRPEIGGIVDTLLFKPLSISTDNISFRIQNELVLSFFNLITPISVLITPDFNNQLWNIEIRYISLVSKEAKSATLLLKNFTGTVRQSNPSIELTETGDNLVNTVIIYTSEQPGQKLIFDGVINKWVWGRYILTNLETGSDEYNQLISLLNT